MAPCCQSQAPTSWDAENRPATVSGNGNRMKKTEGGETILYVNKYFEANLTTSENTSYYYSGGVPARIIRVRHLITKIMLDWHLYLVRCRDGSLYTGITTDVARRFAEHRGNGDAGAKYLRGRKPLVLVFQKELGSRSLALGVESKVKKLSRARKEALIRADTRIEVIIKQVSSRLTV